MFFMDLDKFSKVLAKELLPYLYHHDPDNDHVDITN